MRLAVTVACAVALGGAAPSFAKERPVEWAVPVEKPGLPNLHRVTGWLYRGAQPTDAGMRALAEMGIRTVVDLRAWHSDEKLIAGTGLALVHIPIHTNAPHVEQVIEFLRVAADPARRPIFVHCQHGADRTGMMMAMFRIAALGWTREAAIAEMRDGGFGFHAIWQNLIDFILKADLALIQKSAKL
ncbi:MAG TPA: tyrosine-protein phosphatase [Polyangia bacterium]|nr:tyrosine-protein phosphatase [Polyangia bacterium]